MIKILTVSVLLAVSSLLSLSAVFADNGPKEEVILYTHGGQYRMSPPPVLHSDLYRIKVLEVEKLQGPRGKTCTKITYKPHYGKIDSESYAFRKKHETQSVSIVLLGDHVAKVESGDILRICYYPN